MGKVIKEIVRDLGVSRNTVRKMLRSGETAFAYERGVQPLPKLGPSTADLAVPQRVRTDPLADTGSVGRLAHGPVQLPDRDRVGVAAARKQPPVRQQDAAPLPLPTVQKLCRLAG